MDFEALAPIGDDFWGMKKLLEQLLPHTVVDLGDLADAIIADPELASIVKVVQPEDETASAAETAAAAETVAAEATETAAEATETAAAAVVGGSEKPAPSLEDVRDDTYDLYAMTALVDLRRQKDKGSVSAALAWLKKQAEPSGTDIEGWLRRQSAAGLVLANRFVNIPPPLGVRLYSTLVEDMKTCIAEKKCSQMKGIVFISKAFVVPGTGAPELIPKATTAGGGKKEKKKRKEKRKDGEEISRTNKNDNTNIHCQYDAVDSIPVAFIAMLTF